jgi:hypothetical protein
MKIAFVFLLANSLIHCTLPKSDEKNSEPSKEVASQGKFQPKISIQVNRHYDSKGNLQSFDSTYSVYYSNRIGDRQLLDSLFSEFKPLFKQDFPMLNDDYLNELFLNDSLFYNDFFHRDFFQKRFELNDAYLKRMLLQMDSTKNEFFRRQSKEFKK